MKEGGVHRRKGDKSMTREQCEKKMKRRRLRKPIRIALEVLACAAAVAVMLIALFGAVLQESYKLYPPTDEEIAEIPALEVYRP